MATGIVNPYAVAAGGFFDEVEADSPLVWYKMDETSGTVMVDSGSVGNDGSYGTTYSPGLGQRSVFGYTVPRFNNADVAMYDDSAALGTNHPGSSGVATWEFLVNFESVNKNDYILASPSNSRACQLRLLKGYQGNLKATIMAWNGDTVMEASSSTFITLINTDYHIVVTYARATPRCEIWLNGVSVAVDTTATTSLYTSISTDTNYVGAAGNSGITGITGGLGSVAMYPSALSDARIADHYAAL